MFGLTRQPKSEHPNEGEESARSRHVVEIIRPEVLGQWALEKNRSLELLQEAMHDWGERLGNPSQRPVCLTCPHQFQVERTLPPAQMFVRLSVNEAGVPNKMTLIGICERCAPNDDSSLLREGLPELRRAFPDMPEFEMLMSEQGNGDAILVGSFCFNWWPPDLSRLDDGPRKGDDHAGHA
jgi:hypothetical protein